MRKSSSLAPSTSGWMTRWSLSSSILSNSFAVVSALLPSKVAFRFSSMQTVLANGGGKNQVQDHPVQRIIQVLMKQASADQKDRVIKAPNGNVDVFNSVASSSTMALRNCSGIVWSGLLFTLRNTHSSLVRLLISRSDLVCVPRQGFPPWSLLFAAHIKYFHIDGDDHSWR